MPVVVRNYPRSPSLVSDKVKPRSLDHQSLPFPVLPCSSAPRASADVLNDSLPIGVVSTPPFHTQEWCDISQHTDRCSTRGLGRMIVALGNFITC